MYTRHHLNYMYDIGIIITYKLSLKTNKNVKQILNFKIMITRLKLTLVCNLSTAPYMTVQRQSDN